MSCGPRSRSIAWSLRRSIAVPRDSLDYPGAVSVALKRLRDAGVDGPFAVALTERCYISLTEATEGGYPVLDHVRHLVDGPLVWVPGPDGALAVSMRGGDFELSVGQDFAIGCLDHVAERVRLYIEASFTVWRLTPQAAVPLVCPPA